MDVFELTRALVDIESVTGNEAEAGLFLIDYLTGLAVRTGGAVERMDIEPRRFNVLARWGDPMVTLSTHFDVVPPWFGSSEDSEYIYGRGSCDAKGIAACMIKAAEGLLGGGWRGFALLFVAGEERNSAGALAAAEHPCGSRFLVNGEPTGNKLALGSKGALRYEIVARGRMAHSAYPELGESAILKLLDVLERIRRIRLPEDEVLGVSTMNIGTISGGRAPNVIADEARAEIMFRLVGPSAGLRAAVREAASGLAEAREILEIPAVRLRSLEGIASTVVSFTTDIPAFAGKWGEPLLIGPGDIQVAHTLEERVAKRQLRDAVGIYTDITRRLLSAAA